MPQFDTSTYASQLFWMCLCFGVLVFYIKKYFLPQMTEMLDGREFRIREDLEEAKNFSKEAQEISLRIERRVSEAHLEVKKLIEATLRDEEEKRERQLALLEKEHKEIIAALEAKLKSGTDSLNENKEALVKEAAERVAYVLTQGGVSGSLNHVE
jgi:F-type H+-transporting ATPase subunit b